MRKPRGSFRLVALGLVLLAGAAGAAPFDVLDVAEDGIGGVDGLGGARAVAASPDGAHVYVVAAGLSANAITAFSVAADGTLGFVEVERQGVAGVTGMSAPVDVAIAPDGAHVYVASFLGDAVAVFARDAGDGSLAFVDAVLDADLPSGGLDGASGVAVSPDGQHVYTTAGVDHAVVAFERDPVSGALAFVEIETGDPLLEGAVDLAVSPDGALVYVLAQGVGADALLTYGRDAGTGALTKLDSEKNGENGADGIEFPNAMAIAPGGRDLYTVAGFAGTQGTIPGRLAVYQRSPANDLTSYLGLYADNANGVDGLGYAIGVAVLPDGLTVVTAGGADDALAVFERDPATALLSFDRVVRDDSNAALRLDGAVDVAADPLGRFVYVVALNESALTVFAPEPGAGAALVACLALAGWRTRARGRR